MNQSQSSKRKFRSSSGWKKFRTKIKAERKVDEVSLRPLRAGWNLHHKDLRESNYEDLSDETRFSALNKQTHDIVHDIFRYYQKDRDYLTRLKILLDEMCEINQ